jgi:hypothetical protein
MMTRKHALSSLAPIAALACLTLAPAVAQAERATPAGTRGSGSSVAVPEPITASLVGVAAAGVGYVLFGKRRRNRAAGSGTGSDSGDLAAK